MLSDNPPGCFGESCSTLVAGALLFRVRNGGFPSAGIRHFHRHHNFTGLLVAAASTALHDSRGSASAKFKIFICKVGRIYAILDSSIGEACTMRKLKIYMETTLFNYYFDEDREAHADTVRLFEKIAAGKYEAFTSGAVITELADAPVEKYAMTVLPVTAEAEKLADIYVAEGIIPQKYRTDGVHIAVSAVNDLDMVVSLNFRHIVKHRTILATEKINVLNGWRSVHIREPMQVVDHEND